MRGNIRVTVIPIVNGALGTILKGLEKGLEELEIGEPLKLSHCWNRPEYWEESRRSEETCYRSGSTERPSANVSVKNSQEIK